MLAERLSKAWREHQASVPIEPAMRFAPEGLVVGAQTVLAPAEERTICLDGRETRLCALLAAAHLRPVDARSLNHLRKAIQRRSEGQTGLAQVHLVLSGLNLTNAPRAAAHRLFLADGLMAEGIEPSTILKALGIEPSARDGSASKYSSDQPRVPKGSGRTSGQWTDGAGGNADPSDAASDGHPWGGLSAEAAAELRSNLVPARYDTQEPGAAKPSLVLPDLLETGPKIAPPAANPSWFMRLSPELLLRLGMFALRFGGPVAAFSTVFIPLNKSLRQEGTIPGWPPIDFLWHSDQRSLTVSYLGADGRRVTTIAELGEDGIFRDVDRKPIGRVLPGGAVMIDREALFPKETRNENEPSLCPRPELDKDHKNLNGLLFENFMKALVNPGNPTPSGFGVRIFSAARGNYVYFDDCQRSSGILFEYKSVTYTHLLSRTFWEQPMAKLIRQAKDQVDAARGEHIVWVFAEGAARDAVEAAFNKVPELQGRIQLVSEPWRPGVKI